jgi:hypothetical protein
MLNIFNSNLACICSMKLWIWGMGKMRVADILFKDAPTIRQTKSWLLPLSREEP